MTTHEKVCRLIVILGVTLAMVAPNGSFASSHLFIATLPNALGTGAIGQDYQMNLLAQGGKGPLTWSEVTPIGGALPCLPWGYSYLPVE